MAMIENIPAMEPEAPDQEPRMSPADFVEYVTASENLALELDEDDLGKIARDVCEGFDTDKGTMTDWLQRSEKAIEIAKLVKDDKDYPFKGASNVRYPLITSAALQFSARAYPALVPSSEIVKPKIWGPDEAGEKAARGKRVCSYMSYQLLCEMDEWEPQMDRLLVQLPIVNDIFKKVWHDGERARTKVIECGKFIVNCKAETLEQAPRASEEMELFPHEIEERVRSGWFAELEYDRDDDEDAEPETFIEQHCRLDLDEDGYSEPYVVTVHRDTETVVRLVADFEPGDVRFEMGAEVVEEMQEVPVTDPMTGQTFTLMRPQQVEVEVPVAIQSIKRNHYFVHYQFMPPMDGSLLGYGLGVLLSDIGHAIDSSVNMMMDAGHYQALGGGFIGSEFRVKGGTTHMRPGEYKTVATSGQDIRTALVEKTFPGPSPVMFQMLGLLIDAGKEISSTKDIITGENASQMTATTAMALVEQGMRVFTASYKRIFRALKSEFRLLARINARTLDPRRYAMFLEEQADPQADFAAADMDLTPVADPNAVTKTQEMAKAQLVMELAQGGMVHPPAAGQRILEAAGIDDVEELAPPPPPPEMQQAQMMDMQLSMALKQMTVSKAQADTAKVAGEIQKMQAEIAKIGSSISAEQAGVRTDQFEAQLEAVRTFVEQQRADIDQALALAQMAQGQVQQ